MFYTVLFSASVLFHDCQCINIVVIAIPDLREHYRLVLDIRLTNIGTLEAMDLRSHVIHIHFYERGRYVAHNRDVEYSPTH